MRTPMLVPVKAATMETPGQECFGCSGSVISHRPRYWMCGLLAGMTVAALVMENNPVEMRIHNAQSCFIMTDCSRVVRFSGLRIYKWSLTEIVPPA